MKLKICLFTLCCCVSFWLPAQNALRQSDSPRQFRPYVYAQLGIGQGNATLQPTFGETSLAAGVGLMYRQNDWSIGLGPAASLLSANDYVVAHYRLMYGAGLHLNVRYRRLGLQFEGGGMLTYNEGYSDEGYGFRYFADEG
ncbi:MAG: hypothetical protein AAFQ87_28200, partial [Bacteroidota bacterium]